MSSAATPIGRRVAEAMARYGEGNYESALIQASIAVDATSKRTHPTPSGKSNRKSYQSFVRDYMPIITRVAFGNVTMMNIRVQYSHPDIDSDTQGRCTLEQILYFVVRCGLLHAGAHASDVEFAPDNVIEVKADKLTLPASLIVGLVFAVVVAPENAAEAAPGGHGFGLPTGGKVSLRELWGQKETAIDRVFPT